MSRIADLRDRRAAAELAGRPMPTPGRGATQRGSRLRAVLGLRRPAQGARADLRRARDRPPASPAEPSGRTTSRWPKTSPAAPPIAIDNARLYRDVQENDRRKNEFLAMLAHELRNPLAPIRNAVEILRMLEIEDDNLHWASDIISRQVDHLVRLVDDLLDISRITGGKIQLRNETGRRRGRSSTRAVETSRPLIDARKHELTCPLPAGAAAGRRRPGPAGPGARQPAEQRREVHRGRREDRCSSSPGRATRPSSGVRDNGIGISAEMLSRVFDLFTQVDRSLDRSQGGLGIGLTLVRRLVEMHGGTRPGPQRGRRTAAASSSSACPHSMKLLPSNSSSPALRAGSSGTSVARRILIVDDYPAGRREPDEGAGAGRPRGAGSRSTGRALEEISTFQPEVVVLDIGLPGHGRLRGGPPDPH